MYDLRINFHEEDEAKEQIEMIKKHCDHMRDDLCMEFIKGYMTAIQDYRDKFQTGFSQIQILYIGYHIYQWLTDRHLTELKEKEKNNGRNI